MTAIRHISAILLATCVTAKALPNVPVDFEKQILPIFAEKCFKCHSSLTKKPKGGLKMDDVKSLMEAIGGKEAIVPGNPADSDFMFVLNLPSGDDDIMPPAKENTPTTQRERDLIEKWIEQGASLGEFTEYKHDEEHVVLEVSEIEALDTAAAARKIDLLIAAGLKKDGIEVNDPVGDEIFLRRNYLNIIGRNPTFAEARAFLTSEAPEKNAKLVDILLASEGYTSHAINYWGDALRILDNQGSNDIKPYNAWLKNALNDNMPYDELVNGMLSSTGRYWEDPRIGFYFRDEKNRLAGVEAVSSLFLGTQIGCAQCHDHPYDKWTQKDYYQFEAFYNARTPFIPIQNILGEMDSRLINTQRGQLSDYFNKTRLSGIMEKRGEDPGKLRPTPIDFEGVSKETNAELAKRATNRWFASYASGMLVNRLRNGIYFPYEKAWGKLPENYLYDDGKPGQSVPPAVLFGNNPEFKHGDDLAPVLADWITSPENVRFTKVITNRLWTRLMGYPLSGPVDEVLELHRSANPDLVLYLEGLMRATGYDMKQFLRILANTDYYQRSASTAAFDELHPKLLAGPLLQRLTAEQIWDSIALLVDDSIDERINLKMPDQSLEATLYEAKNPEEYWTTIIASIDGKFSDGKIIEKQPSMMMSEAEEPEEDESNDLKDKYKRASEVGQPAPGGHFLSLFGQSDRELMDNSWANPTVPQALALLNGSLYGDLTNPESSFAKAIAEMDTTDKKIATTFISILGRLPSRVENTAAANYVRDGKSETAYADLAWSLINTRQFLFKN